MKLLLNSIALLGLIVTTQQIAMDKPEPVNRKRSLDSLLDEPASKTARVEQPAITAPTPGQQLPLSTTIQMLANSFSAQNTPYDTAIDTIASAIVNHKKLTKKVAEGSDFGLAIRLLERQYPSHDQAAIASSLFNAFEQKGDESSAVRLIRALQ